MRILVGTVVRVGPTICAISATLTFLPVNVSPNTMSSDPVYAARMVPQAARIRVATVISGLISFRVMFVRCDKVRVTGAFSATECGVCGKRIDDVPDR